MINGIIFDLDDTLLSKKKYDYECFKNISKYLNEKFKIPFIDLYYDFRKEYDELNRRFPINAVLKKRNIYSDNLLNKLIQVYRSTKTEKCLYPETIDVLKQLIKMKKKLFIITDGKIEAQKKKIINSGLEHYFIEIIFTSSLGFKKEKPDPTSFKYLIKKNRFKRQELIHIGDNPYRDFINIKKLGIKTLRIIRADSFFKDIVLPEIFQANHTINSLQEIFKFIS